MRLRVGLVGLGDAWQRRHAPALRTLSDRFEVRAICDQVGHRAKQAAADFQAAAVDGYRALTLREDLDAVLILSPQWFGALPVLAACRESGKAVYCTAGLDLEPEQVELVKRRVEEAGIAFVAEFPRRHAPATVRLKELIATQLGAVRLAFCHQRCKATNDQERLAGCSPHHSAVRDLIELADWCCYVVDREPATVLGMMHRRDADSVEEDYQMMSLDFSDRTAPDAGPVVQISCGDYIPSHWEEAMVYRPAAALQVSCEHGTAFVDLPSTLVWFNAAGRHQETLDSERPVGERLLSQFHRAVTSLVRKTSDLEDTCRAVNLVQQARRSHAEGRRIEID